MQNKLLKDNKEDVVIAASFFAIVRRMRTG